MPILIGIGVAMLTTAIANISAGIPFWYGMGKAAVVGAISGAISFGIGGLAKSAFTSFYSQAAFQAGAHGLKSGLMSVIEGGDFLSGFAAGAISSIVSSGVEALGNSGAHFCVDDAGNDVVASTLGSRNVGALKAVMIASGGLSGGISSSIAGGSFWKGVREGLITSGLNHVAHMLVDDGGGGKPRTKKSPVNNGEIINLHKENGYWGNWHEDLTPEENTIKILAHGGVGIISDDTSGISVHLESGDAHEFLYKNSALYKDSVDNGLKIKIKVYACQTAYEDSSNGSTNFSKELSIHNKNANVTGFTHNIVKYGVEFKGTWNTYSNGSKVFDISSSIGNVVKIIRTENNQINIYRKYNF